MERNSADGNTPDFRLRTLPWKRILIGAAAAAAALLLLLAGIVVWLIVSAPDIDTISVSPAESATYICDADGNYLRKLTLAESNRDIVTLEQIPDSLEKAMIAIEDERFYEHGGIDLRGIARAFCTGILRGSFSEGASTITQQLIKNSVFTQWTQENSFFDRFRRKVQEQYLALQLEDRISKDEILEDYLNTINLGAGCYGVQSASRRYFGKDVSELKLSEAAVLAAIPQNPSGFNPIVYPEANRGRAETVLAYMEQQGYISAAERQEALADDVYARIRTFDESYEEDTAYTYYEDALIDQVMERLADEKGYSADQAYRAVYSGGLRILSAQNQAIQQICDEEFQNPSNFPEGTLYGVDYALSVADRNGLVTHYGSDALRRYIRQEINASFDLMCSSPEEAQGYADAFREHIMEELQREDEDSGMDGDGDDVDSNKGKNGKDSSGDEDSDDSDKDKNGKNSNSEEDSDDSGKDNDAEGSNGNKDSDDSDKDKDGKDSNDEENSDNSGEDNDDASDDTPSASVIGERLTLSPQPQASLVVIDQHTGYVQAIVGGRGEKTASLTLNRATETTRQPGSTFKILTAYAPALDSFGQTLATVYENEPYKYEDGTPVSNWDITDYSGDVTVREAITRSINVIAVKCITEITPRAGLDCARRLGISTLHETYQTADGVSSDLIQPLALGGITEGVTNLELCNAYAAIANGGVRNTPKFFTKVLDRNGAVILDNTAQDSESDSAASALTDNFKSSLPASSHVNLSGSSETALPASSRAILSGSSETALPASSRAILSGSSETALPASSRAILSGSSESALPASTAETESGTLSGGSARVLQASTAFLLTDAMRSVVSDPSGTAYGAISAAGQPVAGKTGTTSSYKDIWFVGYTPYYTCCVWGGYDNNQELPDGSTYHTYNRILWSAVMNRIHNGLPPADFPVPDDVVQITLCKESNLRAVDDACPDTYEEYFAAGTEPTEECMLHEPVPETEPIIIYQDILDQLLTESESESETDTEPESGGIPGNGNTPDNNGAPGSGNVPGNSNTPGNGSSPGNTTTPDNDSSPGNNNTPDSSPPGNTVPSGGSSNSPGAANPSGGITPGTTDPSGSGTDGNDSSFSDSGSSISNIDLTGGTDGTGSSFPDNGSSSVPAESAPQPDTTSFDDLLNRLADESRKFGG